MSVWSLARLRIETHRERVLKRSDTNARSTCPKRNTDQPALDLGAARLLVEDGVEVDALPTNYNFKIAPCDPHHDARRQALGAAHLVRGPVRLIHHKNLKHPHTLCKLVNAAASATRVVVGATACAMHDLSEIRVHEISDGSPWLAAD